MMLDATAGNRMLWPNKNPPNTVFMDKKTDLKIPPDIIAVWEHMPFRDDVFECILFDPPHIIRSSGPDPRFQMHVSYGSWRNNRESMIAIHKAQKEFYRLARRLCFKWCENRDNLSWWKLAPFFDKWKQIAEQRRNTKGSGSIKGDTYWITFIRGLATKVNSNE